MDKFYIITNSDKDKDLEFTGQIVEYLKANGRKCMVQQAERKQEGAYHYTNPALIPEDTECILVLGGDGTILQRAAECAKRKIPVLGINLGKIGFMTEIEIDDMEDAISKFLQDDFTIEKRMMMKAEIRKENKIQFSFHALNDVVVSKVAGEKLIYMELSTDGVAVNRYTADGLIIATPTGSTGYSISAGGPVVDPCMRLYVATPICAHMLSVRSAVLSSNKDIRIKLDGEYGNADAVVTADGDIQGYIKNADEVIITESEYDFELIKIGEQSFYDTLIKKLS